MTIAEKLEMYREKKQFIDGLCSVFKTRPKGSSVSEITYEVYKKSFGEDRTDFREWIVVHFDGGGSSPRLVTGNSNTANLKVLFSLDLC